MDGGPAHEDLSSRCHRDDGARRRRARDARADRRSSAAGVRQSDARALEDQARLSIAELAAHGDRLAFTTDTYVVTPIEFPGGDIGKLAVCGTVNDLAVCGARPLFLSCGWCSRKG
jgi:hydrogenase maturation factor